VAQPSEPRLDRIEQFAVGDAERSHVFPLEFGGDRREADAGFLGLAPTSYWSEKKYGRRS
jgi:hypothetical protein